MDSNIPATVELSDEKSSLRHLRSHKELADLGDGDKAVSEEKAVDLLIAVAKKLMELGTSSSAEGLLAKAQANMTKSKLVDSASQAAKDKKDSDAGHTLKRKLRQGSLESKPSWFLDRKQCSKGSPKHHAGACKTCNGPKAHHCTSCHEDSKHPFLAARQFATDSKGKKVVAGICYAAPALESFNYRLGVNCTWSVCRDGETGEIVGDKADYDKTTKVACSRVCLVGGTLTMVGALKRHANTDGTGETTMTDVKFRDAKNKSAPVCSFHKVALCEKAQGYDAEKCKAWKENGTGGEAKHCQLEDCHVTKKLGCVAILPAYKNPSELGTDLTAYMNECKHAVSPCALPGLYV